MALENGFGCVFCDEVEDAIGFKDNWICHKCFDDLYELFSGRYYVKKVRSVTKKVEALLDRELKL